MHFRMSEQFCTHSHSSQTAARSTCATTMQFCMHCSTPRRTICACTSARTHSTRSHSQRSAYTTTNNNNNNKQQQQQQQQQLQQTTTNNNNNNNNKNNKN